MPKERTYFVSFRIEEGEGYADRNAALIAALRALAGFRYWNETPSFILFSTEATLQRVIKTVRDVIDEAVDLAVIGAPGFKTMRVIGACHDDDIFKLVPFAK